MRSRQLFKSFKTNLWWVLLTLMVALAVFQDYLFSRVQDTGFYLSESLLYNSIWIFLIPFTFLEFRILKTIYSKSRAVQGLATFGISAGFSLLHILIFAATFISISHFVFSPTHQFSHIFNAAISNQLSIVFLYYFIAPFLNQALSKTQIQAEPSTKYPDKVNVKMGTKILNVETATIQLISKDKPYSVIFAHNHKYLDDRSLKDFEKLLDPNVFLRVHRSTIVNCTYIKEYMSRQNGDYDVLLENGQTIRMSRHFRSTWAQLLQ